MKSTCCFLAKEDQRGFILLTVSVALITIGLIALSLQRLGNTTARGITSQHSMEKARLAAEAGLAHGIRNILAPSKSTPANKCNDSYSINASTGVGPEWLAHTFGNGASYSVSFGFDQGVNDEPGEVMLRSTGIAEGMSVTLSRGFSSLKYRNSGKPLDCGTSDPYLCSLFPTKDKHVCSWGCSSADPKSLIIQGEDSPPKVMTAIDFGVHARRSEFDNRRVLLARIGFYVVDTTDGSAGNVTLRTLVQASWNNWAENSVTYDDVQGMTDYLSSSKTWVFRSGRGLRWADVTPMFRNWISPPLLTAYRGIVFRPATGVKWTSLLSREEDITSSIRDERPRFDLRPRLEVFFIPKGSC